MKSTAVWESDEIGMANSPQPNDDPGLHAASPRGVQDSAPIASQDKIQRLKQMALRLFREMQSLNEVHTLNIDGGLDFYDEVTRFEIDLITQALLHTGGHQGRAARLLNLKVTTLNSKIKHYDIKLEGFAAGYPFGNAGMEARPNA
jgi:DNA-binding NtrC family response regulator